MRNYLKVVASAAYVGLVVSTVAAAPATAIPRRTGADPAHRVELWACDGSATFRMRFTRFRRGPHGSTIANVGYADLNPLNQANPGWQHVTIRGAMYRVGAAFDFHLSADGRRLELVSQRTGDPISCIRR
jgi:hypothetical protein